MENSVAFMLARCQAEIRALLQIGLTPAFLRLLGFLYTARLLGFFCGLLVFLYGGLLCFFVGFVRGGLLGGEDVNVTTMKCHAHVSVLTFSSFEAR